MLISLANRLFHYLFPLKYYTASHNFRFREHLLDGYDMRFEMKSGQAKEYMCDVLNGAFNPIPPKKFRVRRNKGGIVDVCAPAILERASKKTESLIIHKLSNEEKQKLLELIAKRKAIGLKRKRHNWSLSNSVCKGLPRVSVKADTEKTGIKNITEDAATVGR